MTPKKYEAKWMKIATSKRPGSSAWKFMMVTSAIQWIASVGAIVWLSISQSENEMYKYIAILLSVCQSPSWVMSCWASEEYKRRELEEEEENVLELKMQAQNSARTFKKVADNQ